MPLLDARELLHFPDGDNTTDTIVNDVHLNLTALKGFNYSIYSNKTISNASNCFLIFDDFKPYMFDNGSWVNATTCYVPYYGIRRRGIASIIFGTLFGLSIIFTLVNLRKHGRLYLRESKRFRAVGRRWQWYWMLFVAACGMISTLTGVDVDRYYLQQMPIVLQSLFFALMMPGALAMVWEATRHWGSWQERQIVDRDPFTLPQDDKRARTEFWLPLIFYLFAWLNFFMTIPRPWTPIEKQNTPEDKETIARPAATGPREKAGAIFAAFAWFVICYSLYHSLKCYKARPEGVKTISALFRDSPRKVIIATSLLAVRIAYGLASAWLWDLSISKHGVAIKWPFGLGYGPILLIIFVFEVAGFKEKNEDKLLIQQRRARDQLHDRELGLAQKPSWWGKNWSSRYWSDDQRLRNLTSEVMGSGKPTNRSVEQGLEMGRVGVRSRSGSRQRDGSFRDGGLGRGQDSLPVKRPTADRMRSDGLDASRSRRLSGGTLTTVDSGGRGQQQRIRSMLDV